MSAAGNARRAGIELAGSWPVRGVVVDVLLFAGVLVMGSAYDRLHYASAGGWGAALIALAILVRVAVADRRQGACERSDPGAALALI